MEVEKNDDLILLLNKRVLLLVRITVFDGIFVNSIHRLLLSAWLFNGLHSNARIV